jgi:hypothetical protein
MDPAAEFLEADRKALGLSRREYGRLVGISSYSQARDIAAREIVSTISGDGLPSYDHCESCRTRRLARRDRSAGE